MTFPYNPEHEYNFAAVLRSIEDETSRAKAGIAAAQWLLGVWPDTLNRTRETETIDALQRALINFTHLIGVCRALYGDKTRVEYDTRYLVDGLIDEANRLVKVGANNHVFIDTRLVDLISTRAG